MLLNASVAVYRRPHEPVERPSRNTIHSLDGSGSPFPNQSSQFDAQFGDRHQTRIAFAPEELTSVARGGSPEIVRRQMASSPDGDVVNHGVSIRFDQRPPRRGVLDWDV